MRRFMNFRTFWREKYPHHYFIIKKLKRSGRIIFLCLPIWWGYPCFQIHAGKNPVSNYLYPLELLEGRHRIWSMVFEQIINKLICWHLSFNPAIPHKIGCGYNNIGFLSLDRDFKENSGFIIPEIL